MLCPIRSPRPALTAGFFVLVAVACPIQRPPVPAGYLEFRSHLQSAVADTAGQVLAGRLAAQERLDERLPELSALLATDSLVASLARDSLLAPLAAAVSSVIASELDPERTSGKVRKAFGLADGQRLAVDAIVIGLGTALRKLRHG